jgi:dolichol-phosphate mannosyltransferase
MATTNDNNILKPRREPELLSIVLPFFNEEESIASLQERLASLRAELNCRSEVICVNDGSQDRTGTLLDAWAASEADIRVIHFTKNFGHQIAVTAGLDHLSADTDAAVIMDSDLQDPPEVIKAMISKYRDGYDVVSARRLSRDGESLFKRCTAHLFYRLMRLLILPELPPDTGDFRLLSRRAVDAFVSLREQHRFLRAMSVWIGFPQTTVEFHRPARAQGETKYPLHKMLALSWNAAVSFSTIPLRLTVIFGLTVTSLAIVYFLYSIFQKLIMGDTVPGWTAIVTLQCLIGATILMAIGILGEYVARIFEETKGRPLYLIREIVNAEEKENAPTPSATQPVKVTCP